MRIMDNILLAHEIIRNYSRNSGKSKCTMKVDLKKAFDSISWDFLQECLINLNFPNKFMRWIMICVRTTFFFVMINGRLEGFF